MEKDALTKEEIEKHKEAECENTKCDLPFFDIDSLFKQKPIRCMPEPTDPLAGFILSQGQPVLHLSYFLFSNFFLKYS